MTRKDLKQQLLNNITSEEWIQLEQKSEDFIINDFNRGVMLRLKENKTKSLETVPEKEIEQLSDELKDYLNQYMQDQPQAHKWIIFACIYLTYIEQVPMHPQDKVNWIKREDGYFCPYYSGEGACLYCMCEKLV